jgi:hypothetical protein
MDNLSEVYLSVYQELDEVRGGGRIDPVSDFPHHSERGSRRPKDAELRMSPLDRAEARANALKKRNDPEAARRANRITSRFVGPTKRGLGRAIDASNTARFAEKKRLMNAQESYDLFDAILEYLVAEGYADTNAAAIKIMANMSEEWRESITEGAYEDRIAANNKKYDRNRQRAAQRAAARNRARQEGKTGNVPGVGYVSPRPEGETYRDSSGVERHTSGARMPKKDS